MAPSIVKLESSVTDNSGLQINDSRTTMSQHTPDSWGENKDVPSLRSPSPDHDGFLRFLRDAPQAGEEQAPQAGEQKVPQSEGETDDVSVLEDPDDAAEIANYVDVDKLLTPSSSEYYYSPANKANRLKLENYKPATRRKSNTLEESGHSRHSMLSTRSHTSSYRGPDRRKGDGSSLKSAMKRGASYKASRSMDNFDMSMGTMNSAPIQEHEEEQKPLMRCCFSSVDIREHERDAGDNPCVSSGVPLSLGWGYYQNPSVDLNDYELNKGQRDKIEMLVPAPIRRQILRDEFGVSVTDMNASMKNVAITKRQRRHTVAAEHMEAFHEASESISRKLKRFLKKTSTSKEEKKMWEKAENVAMKKRNENGGDAKVAPRNEAPPVEISFNN